MRYAWLTIRHKWFVFLAGLKTRAPLWRLIIHDWTKFTPAELPHYQRQFFGKADDPKGFTEAWIHHQNRNPHHWEYWIPRTGHNRCRPPYPDGEPVTMPEWAVREMVADWMGATRAYDGKWPKPGEWLWMHTSIRKLIVTRGTFICLERVLNEVGYWRDFQIGFDERPECGHCLLNPNFSDGCQWEYCPKCGGESGWDD